MQIAQRCDSMDYVGGYGKSTYDRSCMPQAFCKEKSRHLGHQMVCYVLGLRQGHPSLSGYAYCMAPRQAPCTSCKTHVLYTDSTDMLSCRTCTYPYRYGKPIFRREILYQHKNLLLFNSQCFIINQRLFQPLPPPNTHNTHRKYTNNYDDTQQTKKIYKELDTTTFNPHRKYTTN